MAVDRDYAGNRIAALSDRKIREFAARQQAEAGFRSLFMPIFAITNTPRIFFRDRHIDDSHELLNSVTMIG
jgi:hypothetical protein